MRPLKIICIKRFFSSTDDEKPYFQSVGTKGYWLPEKEHRYIGDLDLNRIPDDCMIVIVQREDEIERVREIFKGELLSFHDKVK
ncbi:MAG: hypothetical protein NTV06_05000 [candidate division Zixibacteria bacterium]|nr:hypothetical protein [candidate division Zixibacteria bacterium]